MPQDSLITSQYHEESFFSETPYFHTEVSGEVQGVGGDPMPYTIANDNLLTALLLGCCILTVVAVAFLRDFFARLGKNIFRIQYGTTEVNETSGELWMQLCLMLQCCLLLSIFYFLYIHDGADDVFIFEPYQIIGLFTLVLFCFFLIKFALYGIVGWVFFDVKKNEQWIKDFLFLISLEGTLLFPQVMLLSFFNLSVSKAAFVVGITLIFVKISSFYRIYLIFFQKNRAYLKYILYLCALEAVPIMVLWGILELMSQYLKVNF